MSTDARTILALDLANRTGWAYLAADSRRLFGAWDIAKPWDDHPGDRLERLRSGLLEFLRKYPAELIACEESPLGSGQRNPHVAVVMAELVAVAKLVAADRGVPIVLFAPITVKAFAGCAGKHTRRDKSAMLRACERLLGVKTDDDNIADALFILEMARQGYAAKTKPKSRRRREPSPQGRLFK